MGMGQAEGQGVGVMGQAGAWGRQGVRAHGQAGGQGVIGQAGGFVGGVPVDVHVMGEGRTVGGSVCACAWCVCGGVHLVRMGMDSRPTPPPHAWPR